MANHPTYNYLDIGTAGEDLVAHWLQSQGWTILHRRWRYRQGEIDIIAQHNGYKVEFASLSCPSPSSSSPLLAFVEVKTRSPENWDAGGKSAVTQHKQAKLWRTALMFLAKYPEKADYSCQFDVAIVCCQPISKEQSAVKISQQALAGSLVNGHQLLLQEYIVAAFDTPGNE